MNDETKNKEKESQTYKKYAKLLGKLYWEKHNDWDYDSADYKTTWTMIMIEGIHRRWGTGKFLFTITTIGAKKDEWRSEYRSACSRILNQLKHGNLIEVDHTNPVPPSLDPK